MIVTIADAMRREAKIEQAHNMVLHFARKRFGEPDASTLQILRAITDLERLDRMSEVLLDLKTWEELLSVA